jgi:hypothetical protein
VADLIRVAGQGLIEHNRHWITAQHRKVLRAIRRCRTTALIEHLDECPYCGYRTTSFTSCRDRHGPKCQAQAREPLGLAVLNVLWDIEAGHVAADDFLFCVALDPLRAAVPTHDSAIRIEQNIGVIFGSVYQQPVPFLALTQRPFRPLRMQLYKRFR